LILLDTTTRTLEVLLGGAVTTSQLPAVATYVDTSFTGATPVAPASSNTATNNTTAVTVLAAPAASTQRKLLFLSLFNADTVAAVVTLRYNDNGTLRKVLAPTLQAGETLLYNDGEGFRVLDASGAVKHAWTGYQIARSTGFAQVNADGSVEVSPASGTNFTLDGGQCLIPIGSVALPSLAFGAQPTLGWARVVANRWSFVQLGVEKMQFGGNLFLGSGVGLAWMPTAEPGSSTADLVLQRDAASVLALRSAANPQTFRVYESFGDASNGTWLEFVTQTGGPFVMRPNANGSGSIRGVWYQGAAGRARLTANATNATATMSGLSDLSVTLLAGRKYTGTCRFIARNSTGAEGLAFDFNGGGATMTSFHANVVGTPIGATVGVSDSTALGTALTCTAVATTDVVYEVNLTMVVNAGGTFIPRFAEVSHTSGTATVGLGSWLALDDSPN
jgi:hypothetical protein